VPTVSICLPVYNGEKYLGEAIKSILAQTYEDYELLISNDCSTDSSLEIANSFARQDSRIVVWTTEKNLGLFQNYNKCIQRARGRFIKPFAQDDLFAPSMLSRCLDALSADDSVALVCTSRTTIDEQGQAHKFNEQLDSTRLIEGNEAIKGCLVRLHNWIGEPSAVMFPASRAGSGFDIGYYHLGDLEYWFRVIAGGRLLYLHEPLCSFRFHPESTSNKNMKSMLFTLDALRLGKMYEEYLQDAGVDATEYRRQALEFSSWFVHDLARREGFTAEQSAQINCGNADKDELLRQFRELAFHALYLAHETHLRAEAVKSELEGERVACEDHLRGVLNSPVWQALNALKLTQRRGGLLPRLSENRS
jgi:glycosyltransferase involved in cell wall biosynthesis